MKNKVKSDSQSESKENETKKKSGMESGLEALALYSQLGLTMTIPILVGAFAGNWLDNKLGTRMVFSVVLIFLGIASGIVSAYRLIKIGMRKK